MRDLFYFAEKLVIALAKFMLNQPEMATIILLILFAVILLMEVKKYVGKKFTKTEQKYPELEKLKKVETETTTTGQGQFLLAITRIGIVLMIVFVILVVFS